MAHGDGPSQLWPAFDSGRSSTFSGHELATCQRRDTAGERPIYYPAASDSDLVLLTHVERVGHLETEVPDPYFRASYAREEQDAGIQFWA
jgi:hypothetical protein